MCHSTQQLQAAEAAVTQLLLALTGQAPAAMAKAAAAVKPLLLHGAPATVAVVTAALQQLYEAASTGTVAPDGAGERMQQGLRQLAAGVTATVGGGATAPGCGQAAAGQQPSSRTMKRAATLDEADEDIEPKKPCLDTQRRGKCWRADGEQVVCDWCCEATMHPGCAGLLGGS